LIFSSRRTKIPRLQAPRQLETLDDLLAQAAHYANSCMRNSGKMAPTLFLIGADGPIMFATGSLADEDEKDAFATNARLLCIACAATACVMALESWMKLATPGEELDMTEPPSEAFDRQEVIVLMGESHTGQKQKYLPIIRSDNGKFFGGCLSENSKGSCFWGKAGMARRDERAYPQRSVSEEQRRQTGFSPKPLGRRVFCRWPALAQPLQPALGMRGPGRLGHQQNPLPQDPFQFSERH